MLCSIQVTYLIGQVLSSEDSSSLLLAERSGRSKAYEEAVTRHMRGPNHDPPTTLTTDHYILHTAYYILHTTYYMLHTPPVHRHGASMPSSAARRQMVGAGSLHTYTRSRVSSKEALDAIT